MEQNEFVETEQGVADADLDDLERTFHFIFPNEVRSHYLRYNGGSPANYLFKKDDTVFVVHEFLPMKHGKHLFEQSFRNLKVEKEILPKHLVPFAVDPGDDYYCFSVREEDVGSIWIYRGSILTSLTGPSNFWRNPYPSSSRE